MTKKKDYGKLSKGSKSKIASTLERLDKVGISVKKAKAMTDSELRKAFYSGKKKPKKASLEGFKRNIRQITFTQEHRKKSVNIVIAKYKKFGFKGAKLKQLEKDLTKVAGSSFISISEELQKLGYEKYDSYDQAEFLLKIPKDKYDTIPIEQRDILRDFGT